MGLSHSSSQEVYLCVHARLAFVRLTLHRATPLSQDADGPRPFIPSRSFHPMRHLNTIPFIIANICLLGTALHRKHLIRQAPQFIYVLPAGVDAFNYKFFAEIRILFLFLRGRSHSN